MVSYFDKQDIISFINYDSYNEQIEDITSIIKNYDFSTLIPITLSNGIIVCYDINTLDIVQSIIEYDENITSLMLFNSTISCENLVKICNLVIKFSINNLYFVKCAFAINTENKLTIDDYTKLITGTSFINSICINSSKQLGNGFDLLFNCMFKLIPFHFKFVGSNKLDDNEYQVFDKLLNFYNSNYYYIDLKMCNLLEDNFVQFLETLKNNTTIVKLSLSSISALHSGYFPSEHKNNKDLFIQLIDILSKNTSIYSLDLSNVMFNYEDGFGNIIAPLLEKNTTLTELNLNDCNIGYYYNRTYHENDPVYEKSFYEALAKNSTLLSLTMTIYSERVIRQIANALSINSGLQQLKLDTRIRQVYDDFDEIMEPIRSNTSLVSLSLIRYTTKREWEAWDDCPDYFKLSYP